MEILLDPQNWVALATLAALEIVLGIDNVIFISILAGKLPPEQRERARKLGLAGAMLTRLALLFSLAWVIGLTQPLFTVFNEEISGRDLVLLIGGLFLLGKSTHEIHGTIEGDDDQSTVRVAASFAGTIVQIMLLDIVFSLDSVITAVGMVDHVSIMATAVVLATVVMVLFSGPVSRFVARHPTVKMLALSFLILIGVALIAEGFDLHIPKGYIYFAMAFSVIVEMLNLRLRRKSRGPARATSA
ncbi:TerC family protein [Caldimonas brevitalea]|uniref:Membrane protein n=1 Tax=Caldimonas brevitalea TaxID=413882 RepID=A0A0G3BC40_9BURK|nr:TerC family protein [Caldimonas brevitalea]AKJ26877.1 membrane protein [Caldimonas brevitalea]